MKTKLLIVLLTSIQAGLGLHARADVQIGVPVNNFAISNTSVSCKGSANGVILIKALQAVSAIATINGPGISAKRYAFTNTLTVSMLAAGNYNVCITIPADASFQQCFNSNITEPKDLGVYATVVKKTKRVVLSLTGAASYTVALNGATYTTTKGRLTLPLAKGVNKIAVSTDKPCQGIINKIITIADRAVPLTNIVNVNTAEDNLAPVMDAIYRAENKTVYNRTYSKQSEVLQVDRANFSSERNFLTPNAGIKRPSVK